RLVLITIFSRPFRTCGGRFVSGAANEITALVKMVFLLLLALVVSCGNLRAQAAASVATFGPPFQANAAALAPDGQHVAYDWRQTNGLFIAVITVAYPDQKVLVPVPPLGEPGAIRGLNSPPPYIEIIALRWIAADRLVFATNDQRIFAVNVEGNDLRLLADPVSLAVRPDLGDTANQALSPL